MEERKGEWINARSIKRRKGHSMSSQPPAGWYVTDLAKILHIIWDRKKLLGAKDERSETSEAS